MAHNEVKRSCPRCGLEITVWPLGRGRWSSTYVGAERCHEYQAQAKANGEPPVGWQCREIEQIRLEVVQEHDTSPSDHLSPCRALAFNGDDNP